MIKTFDVDLDELSRREDFLFVRDEMIPTWEQLIEDTKRALSFQKNARQAIDDLCAAINEHSAARKKVMVLMASMIEKDKPLIDLFKTGAPEDGIDPRKAMDDLLEWFDEGPKRLRAFNAFYMRTAQANVDSLKKGEASLHLQELCLGFWRNSLDLRRAEYVFDKAEAKYKTRVCRDCLKLAKSAVSSGEIMMRFYEEHKHLRADKTPPLMKYVESYLERARNAADIFGKIKTAIESGGLESGLEIWSRVVVELRDVTSASEQTAVT